MEPLDVRVGQTRGQPEGREPRCVQDFVRVRVADATEDRGIRQGTFQGVVLARQRCAEGVEIGVEGLQAARVVRCEPRPAADEM